MMGKVIYLDSHATTPVDQEVLAEMLPYFTEHYGNGNHKAGWRAASAIENARSQVAQLLGARPTEITFTSGATESINIALQGLAKSADGSRTHIVTQRTEHAAVLSCIESLKTQGFTVTMLDVDSFGRVDLKELRQAVTEQTLVVAIMIANNEIGTTQPVEEIGNICQSNGTKFFCDLTQGIGWHEVNVDKMNIDLAAISSHKIYGPRGVGALFIRRMGTAANIEPIIFGGGQERGLRPGTANLPGIVGFGKACQLLIDHSGATYKKICRLRDRLQEQIFGTIKDVKLNGCGENRHPGNLNISIPMVTGEDLIGALPNILFSTTSACSGHSAKPSHVISALGVNEEVLKNTFRIGINKYNTIAEIDYVAKQIIKTVQRLQNKRSVLA